MSELPKRDYYLAVRAAEQFKALFDGTYERWEIAGSVRRRKPLVGDIEHVVIPKFEIGAPVVTKTTGLFGEEVTTTTPAERVNLLMKRCDELLEAGRVEKAVYPDGKPRWGPLTRGVMMGKLIEGERWQDHRWHHELFTTHDEAGWIPLLVLKTGSKDYVRMLVTRLRSRGVYCQDDGHVRYLHGPSKGQIRHVRSEEEYFELCGLRYVPPQLRSIQVK